jgi:cellulose synthase/poly-beta-1,6-N-acetylglucosamine synthase-like glycosyltransferase
MVYGVIFLVFVELILFFGFLEAVILFLYAARWYFFTYVTLKAGPMDGVSEYEYPKSCFVTVLLPIYNEPKVINRLLKACTSFNSPPYEVVVIDDSNDGVTTKNLEAWQSNSKVKVIHRNSRKGWKGGALNVGLSHMDPKTTHVLIFDADFVPPKDIASRFITRFIDNKVDVVQGYQKMDLNSEENWVTKGVRVWTSLYNMVELNGQQKVGLFSPLTGCVFMMRANLLRELKFEEVTDEDWNLTMRLYQKGHKIIYDPSIVASGECPSTLKRLFRQQARWAEGHTRTFRSNFIKIWRSKFLNLREKIDFVFIGASFLNCALIVIMGLASIITLFFPSTDFPTYISQIGGYLLFASIPAAIFASLAALSLEGARKDFSKVVYAWLLNFVTIPVIAFAALKGLLTEKGYFHRTYKTGRVTRYND